MNKESEAQYFKLIIIFNVFTKTTVALFVFVFYSPRDHFDYPAKATAYCY